MTGRRSDASGAPMQGNTAGMGQENGFGENGNRKHFNLFDLWRNRMNDKKRLNRYEDLPLVLDVADIQRIMGISRASAYELVHTPGFPAFRRGRLIKVSKIAFFEWMAKGTETVPRSDKKA